MNFLRHTLAITTIVTLSVVGLTGCSEEPEDIQEIIRPVRSITIAPSESGWITEFQGVVDAVQKADLSFRVSGKLEEIQAKEGEYVQSGQIIARIDATDFQIKLKDRQASYDVSKADLARAEKLIKTGAIARAEVESLKAKMITTGAQLEAARQELNYTSLKAPFAGTIAKRYVDNHEEVSAKQEIVALQDTSSLVIEVELPESVIVRGGKTSKKHQFFARFSSIPNQIFPLRLLEASTQANSNNQTYTVSFIMPAIPGQLILPGMSAQVSVKQVSGKDDTIRVPVYAVQEDARGRFVYLVEPLDDRYGAIERRVVSTGSLSDRGIVITSGLNYGDQLVTAGMSQMTEGMKVRMMNGDVR